MEFILSEDKMSAYVVLHGSEIAAPMEEIIENARSRGILFGFFDRIKERRKTGQPLQIAKGQLPIPAGEPFLTFTKQPKKLPHWKDAVMWSEEVALDQPVEVKGDEIVATIEQHQEAKPGKNVLGEDIPAGSPASKLPIGEGLYIRGNQVMASLNGHLFLDGEKLCVEPLLVVEGDAGRATGNIRFPGMVLVRGNVRSKLELQVRNNLVVTGTVEGSRLQSTQGSIFVKGGIKGGKFASLEAKEAIFCKFAEFATIKASDICVLETSFHCEILARKALHLLEGKGAIVGGKTQVGYGLFARVIGSRSFVYTEVMVATDEQKKLIEQMQKLEEDLATKTRQIRKLSRTARKAELIRAQEMRIQEIKDQMKPLQKELEKTLGQAEICVEDRIYPGSLLRILNDQLALDEEREKISIRKPHLFSPVEIVPLTDERRALEN